MSGRCVRPLLAFSLLAITLSTTGPAFADHEAHEQLLRAYVEVWNSGVVDGLDEIVAEDFQRHDAFGAADSRERLRVVVGSLREFYEDFRLEVRNAIAGPEKGVVHTRFLGRYGKTRFLIDAPSLSMFRFRDGKIAEEWVQGSTYNLWQAFGYSLSPPTATLVPPPVTVPREEPRWDLGTEELHRFAEATRADPPASAGELELVAGARARLFLDGQPVGGLEPGDSVVLALERGSHLVRAESLGGTTFFNTRVELGKGASASLEIPAPGRTLLDPRSRTVEDLESGLEWQMTDNGSNVTLAGARAHCEQLDQGGHADWRLPTLYELEDLYTGEGSGKKYATPDGITLTDCCPWSSTPHGEYQWTWVFHMGMRYLQYESLPWHMRVICVRDAGTRLAG